MSQEYKGYIIIVNVDTDGASKLWNGRFRIMDGDGIVVYETLTDPTSSQEQAKTEATKRARQWVDEHC